MIKSYYFNALWLYDNAEGKRKFSVFEESEDVIQRLIDTSCVDDVGLGWQLIYTPYKGANYKIYQKEDELVAFHITCIDSSAYFISSKVTLRDDLSFDKGLAYVLDGIDRVYNKHIANK